MKKFYQSLCDKVRLWLGVGRVVKAGKIQGGEFTSSILTVLFEYKLNSAGSIGSLNMSSVNTLYFLDLTPTGFNSSLTRGAGRNARGLSTVEVGHSIRRIWSHSRGVGPNLPLGVSVETPGPDR